MDISYSSLFFILGNTNLVYTLIRSKAVFHQLVNLSEVSSQLKKKLPPENEAAEGDGIIPEDSQDNAGMIYLRQDLKHCTFISCSM